MLKLIKIDNYYINIDNVIKITFDSCQKGEKMLISVNIVDTLGNQHSSCYHCPHNITEQQLNEEFETFSSARNHRIFDINKIMKI